MRGARYVVAALLSVALVAAPAGPSVDVPVFGALRAVAAERVQALVPQQWEFRALPYSGSVRGLQASRDLDRWESDHPPAGLEAYWLDATRVRVPSDYYYYAARGPALDGLAEDGRCTEDRKVLAGRGQRSAPPPRWPAEFVATATGTCDATRWGAFAAAPGFGTTRALGIPESGMYVVFVAVREGPRADRRISRLLSAVSFDGTSVGEFLRAVGRSGPRD